MNPAKATDKVVILDWDGTIIVDRDYLKDPAGLEFLPGAAQSDAIVIGDKSSDVELGRRVGATAILIAPNLSQSVEPTPDFVVADLSEAARAIERRESGQRCGTSRA